MLAAIAGCSIWAIAPIAMAQEKAPTRGMVALDGGSAPKCPYGYYDTAPYSCAPYGYYGPEWFRGGAFVGAGPWFHGWRRLSTLPRKSSRPAHCLCGRG